MDAHKEDTAALAGNGIATRLRGLLRRPSPSTPAPAAGGGPSLADELDLELERAKRGGRPLSLLVAEVSSGGTAAVDVFVAVISSEKRRIDTVMRTGEDTFALILPETAEEGALSLAGRLRAEIARALPQDCEQPVLNFGIATFPRHGRSVAGLITAAGRALSAVRALGGNDTLLESTEATATIVAVSDGDFDRDRRLETLLALAETVDFRDQGRPRHGRTVARYAEQIARELGLPVRVSDRIRLAGLLHDVGKVDVPQEVLQKPGPLDPQEWELVRRHAEVGARLIDDAGLADVSAWVLAHHERPDGEGYPRGIKGDSTPLEARIVAVADAYESMTSDRAYRPALSHEDAQAELLRCSGTQFDQRVVQAFLRVLERDGLRVRSRPPVSTA
jgi:diguanylate cyclase (GGDEF)-like protein/putative nucleotidyltransferase with HDIG domain